MRNLARIASAIGAITLIVSCSGMRVPVVPSGSMPARSVAKTGTSSSNYRIVYSFGAAPDGDGPMGNLAYVGGTLYGATRSGGAYDCSSGTGYLFGCGVAFGVTTSGSEVMLHPFMVGNGAEPVSGLIAANGTLYGTTTLGGNRRGGTAYSITPSGSEAVLFNFDRRDRSPNYPATELIDVGGVFYGTTAYGGALRDGTVFSLTAGKISVLHRFRGGSDGAHPSGRLIDVGGTLYGTTSQGGASCGCGTVYGISRSGVEKVLYRFAGGNDGAGPIGRLLDVNGTLYGATSNDGAYGDGTIFSLTTSGKEKVLHAFYSSDGANPNGDLINVKGTLYGTTEQGGSNGQQDGTIFSITLKGQVTVLHSFSGPPDGDVPRGGLVAVGNTLYGTTVAGGSSPCRYTTYSHGHYYCGTVFALTLAH